MNQRLSVRAIIHQDGKTLILRRANGRQSILGKYELPGGKLAYGEQPEDALRRYLQDDAALQIRSAQLYDAVTYIDHDDRDIQYAVLTYMVTLIPDHRAISLSGNYDKYKWQPMSKIHQSDLTDLTELLLGIIQQQTITEGSLHSFTKSEAKDTTKTGYTIYTDGGSRGNPGPSACGYIIIDSNQEVVAQGGEYLGITTNNQAEYQGVRYGLERAKELGLRVVTFRIDSMLVVNQMKGLYKIKNRELWPIHERIRELMRYFDNVSFVHVQREFNQLADGLVNKTLDEHENAQADLAV